MSRHRKIIARVIAFLLLGAIVNVAVAWGCALTSEITDYAFRDLSPRDMRWVKSFDELPEQEVGVVTGFGRRIMCFSLRDPDYDEWLRQYRDNTRGAPIPCTAQRLQSGFPIIAVESVHVRHTRRWNRSKGQSEYTLVTEDRGGRLLEHDLMEEPRSIAWIPVWPGFAINTGFYAAILWMLFAAPFALRRGLRRKRGLCPACGYDLRGRPPGSESQPCPECGAEIHR